MCSYYSLESIEHTDFDALAREYYNTTKLHLSLKCWIKLEVRLTTSINPQLSQKLAVLSVPVPLENATTLC